MKNKIVLFGLTIQSANKGCEALAYSFLNLLNEFYEHSSSKGDITIVMELSAEDHLRFENIFWNNLNISILINRRKNMIARRNIFRAIKESNLVIDFTDGDSFSDIYGLKRFFNRSLDKMTVLMMKKTLILGPQTYGPFENKLCEKTAKYILQNAIVFSRDEVSAELVEELTSHKPKVVTDIAMMLPRDSRNDELEINNNKKNIGINVSSLLYNGGYSGNNQFNLKLDYKAYTDELIQYLVDKNFNVHLIPHVISEKEDYDNIENDLKICKLISEKFALKYDEDFYQNANPMQLKSVISTMDCFIGARMHATIASYSSGVPTIPVAYSKKFKGLFGALEYDYTVDGRELNTEEALTITKEYVSSIEDMNSKLDKSRSLAFDKCNDFKREIYKEVSQWVN